MTKIAIINQKGGVGKTTTATTLASIWSHDLSVLLVDLDPQGNVADAFGLEPGNELYGLFLPEKRNRSITAYHARPGLDIIRSDGNTAILKQIMVGMTLREMALQAALQSFEDQYDLILFDCAPSVDVLHVNAMVASDYLIIPTRLDQWSVKGVRDTLDSTAVLDQMRLLPPEILGVLPTFYERQTIETQLQLNNLHDAFGELLLPPIPMDTTVRMASRRGTTIDEYSPGCRAMVGIEDYGGGYKQAAWKALGAIT